MKKLGIIFWYLFIYSPILLLIGAYIFVFSPLTFRAVLYNWSDKEYKLPENYKIVYSEKEKLYTIQETKKTEYLTFTYYACDHGSAGLSFHAPDICNIFTSKDSAILKGIFKHDEEYGAKAEPVKHDFK